jgi:RND family efflux transporter MFP subunit
MDNHSETSNLSRYIKALVKLLLALAVLAAGASAAAYFLSTKPVVQKKRPQVPNVYVESMTAKKQPVRAVVSGMGTVVPSQQITLRSQVAGTVVSMDKRFVPGGLIPADTQILRVDPSDYEIEVAKRQSELMQARADYQLEQGRQVVARKELELLRKATTDAIEQTDLALRKPQLEQAQAKVAVAESELAKALLNLERTVLTVPFNALVLDRHVDTGSQISAQEALATLAATDEYWVEVAVPSDRLPFLSFRGQGDSAATVYSQTGPGRWQGRALHTLGRIDDQTRMAKVLVSVQNPLKTRDDGGGRLMLGDYVRVEMQGRELGDMIVLPRRALRRGDTVWLAVDGRLEIRPVQIALRNGEQIYVRSGLDAGDAVVLSSITAPYAGMPLDLADRGASDNLPGPGIDQPAAAKSAEK